MSLKTIQVHLPSFNCKECADTAAFRDGTWAHACTGDALDLRYTGPVEIPPGREPCFVLRRER